MANSTLVWFRQDLRLSDNACLATAAVKGPIIPVYILDDETPGQWRWGGASRWWLHHSLESLGKKISLVLRRGQSDVELEKLIKETGVTSLHFTRDYTPWSAGLERRVKDICDKQGVECHRHGGFLLHEPESIRNGMGEVYKVYTPFSRVCFAKGEPPSARPVPQLNFAQSVASDALTDWNLLPQHPNWATGFSESWQPGEQGAQAQLAKFLDEGLIDYAEGRDRPDQNFTSRLSPHLHWGEISPRQVWHATRQAMASANGKLDGSGEKFLKEVLWREFSYHLLHLFPQLPERPFKAEFADFPWIEDKAALHKWKKGQTGYPIVDAGMRQLWATGIMHNRVRMIVASFLIKDLLIPWQQGAAWFWDTLVDADIASNSASWQWVAGCGADAAPYYRIFNPVLQGRKFDPRGDYVRRWVPELSGVPEPFIHAPWEMPNPPSSYPKPMVNHDAARKAALEALKHIKRDAQ
ncbi:MAG: deoxyribodipyrimidine photo-lyase [Aestuariivirga sp.]